jgi:hypothetical protein
VILCSFVEAGQNVRIADNPTKDEKRSKPVGCRLQELPVALAGFAKL